MNKHRNNLLSALRPCIILLCTVFSAAAAQAQMPATTAAATDNRCNAASRVEFRFSVQRAINPLRPLRVGELRPASRYAYTNFNSLRATAMAAPPSAVLGGGTVGQIAMWVSTSSSGNSLLGDSLITQSNGNLGIGITTPASKLTVAGLIETTLGGYKFPDGTLQTTAAVVCNPSFMTRRCKAMAPAARRWAWRYRSH